MLHLRGVQEPFWERSEDRLFPVFPCADDEGKIEARFVIVIVALERVDLVRSEIGEPGGGLFLAGFGGENDASDEIRMRSDQAHLLRRRGVFHNVSQRGVEVFARAKGTAGPTPLRDPRRMLKNRPDNLDELVVAQMIYFVDGITHAELTMQNNLREVAPFLPTRGLRFLRAARQTSEAAGELHGIGGFGQMVVEACFKCVDSVLTARKRRER